MKLAGLELKNPLMNGSGICSNFDMLKVWERSGVGAVVTKGTTVYENYGGSGVKATNPYHGLILNCMKNPSPGHKHFIMEREEYEFEIPLINQLLGMDGKEFSFLARKTEKVCDAFELNVSCSHSNYGGYRIGFKTKVLKDVLKKTRKSTDKPIFVKLPYYSSDYEKLRDVVGVIEDTGMDGITSMNSVGAMDYSPELKRYIIIGGQSGHSIHHMSLFQVRNIRKLTKLPIIASGGIVGSYDVKRFEGVGANAYQLGSGLAEYKTIDDFVKNVMKGL
ncbi:MAG: hypothetical protein V1818_02210 [Candidatus Aenigmatarchaeota archaeon]